MPKLTVIMPTKNCMPYLTECLESLATQTFQDFELYVWENGSTDGTVEELHKWIPSRIPGKVFEGKELNVGESLRELVKLAPTELIARMDGDDICQPTRFEKQLAYLDKNPEIALLGTEFEAIDPTSKIIKKPWHIPCDRAEIIYQLIQGAVLAHNSIIYKKSAVISVGNYQSFRNEDHELWMRISAAFPVANLPERLVSYRFHSKSISQNVKDISAYTEECLNAISQNAPELYGLSPKDFIQLKKRSIKYAKPLLADSVSHLKINFEDKNPLKSKILQSSFRTLIWIWDIRTRLWLARKSKGLIGWVGELLCFIGDIFRKASRN